MYKRQVRLQKILCLLVLIASVLVFAYSLGLVTDLKDSLITTMPYPDDPTRDAYVEGAWIFYDIQPFNAQLLYVGLGMILISLGLFITNTHVRRRYYIGNYIAVGLWSVAAVAASVWIHTGVESFKAQFQNTVNFEQLAAYAEKNNTLLLTRDSTFWFDAHYFVIGVLLVMTVLLVANVFWKISLMKEEAALLAGAPKAEGSAVKAR